MPTTYKLLRTTTGLSDDADFVQTQTLPADLVELKNELQQGKDWERGILLVVEFLDSTGAVALTGATNRGTFDLELIEVGLRPASIAANSKFVTSSVKRTGLKGWEPIVVDALDPGMQVGVRLTNMVGPAGASPAAAKARVLYTEFSL